MRVAIFFDGKNFYKALREFDPLLDIDYEKFAGWLTRRAGDPEARFVGAYYYTGYSADPALGTAEGALAFGGFLDILELLNGYFVRREPRVRRVSVCRACQAQNDYVTEKRVDTRMVAELIQLAAVDSFDVAVILSGDEDFVPAVEAVGALGKQVIVGSWPGQRVARELRARAFGQLDLGSGIGEFASDRRRREVLAPASAAPTDAVAPAAVAPGPERAATIAVEDASRQAVLRELQAAEAQLPYVSRWYFVNHWRGAGLPADLAERERVLEALAREGAIVEYELVDAKGRPAVAIRTAGEGEPEAQAAERAAP